MRVLVFQHYYKEYNTNNRKILRIPKLTEHLITKCTSSVKKYCDINNYDYYLSRETLNYEYYSNKWGNLTLEKYIFASMKASEGDYDVIAVVDTDFLAVSDEPLPYCTGFSGVHKESYNSVIPQLLPKKYYKYVVCGGITLWWKENLHDFAKFISEIAGGSGNKRQLPGSVYQSHDGAFLYDFLYDNTHINLNYLDYKFNIKELKLVPDNPVFFHLSGHFDLKLQKFKSIPKEIMAKILK